MIVEKDTSKGGEHIERDVFLSVSLSVLNSWLFICNSSSMTSSHTPTLRKTRWMTMVRTMGKGSWMFRG